MNRGKVEWYLSLVSIQAVLGAGVLWFTPIPLLVLAPIYMFTPAVAAISASLVVGDSLSELGVTIDPNRWYVFAWLLPVVVVAVSVCTGLLLPAVRFAPSQMLFEQPGVPADTSWVVAVAGLFGRGLLLGAILNTGFALGEEVGWRGLLQTELEPYGFWRASLIVGVVWGLWHAPLILAGYNYPNHPYAGVALMTVFTLLLSPIFAYVRYRTRSTVGAALAHGTLNSVAAIPILLLTGASNLFIGIQGISGIAVLAVANLLLYMRAKPTIESLTAPATHEG